MRKIYVAPSIVPHCSLVLFQIPWALVSSERHACISSAHMNDKAGHIVHREAKYVQVWCYWLGSETILTIFAG